MIGNSRSLDEAAEIGRFPENLTEIVTRVHGDRGRQWLLDLPVLLAECRARWSLSLDDPFENISYNLVFPGRFANGTAIVLKLGVPCDELTTEAAALSLFANVGAARLLDHEVQRGILLMERVIPGEHLFQLQSDADATRTAAVLMRKLRKVPPTHHSFPTLDVWFQALARLRCRYDGGTGPFPSELIVEAEQTLADLLATSKHTMILHGDLHHGNILFSEEDGWTAIDPKGIAGDPGYEIGPFMMNNLPSHSSESATLKLLNNRLSVFSDELHISCARLTRWAFCYAVLSALWDFEESAEWAPTIKLALLLKTLVEI